MSYPINDQVKEMVSFATEGNIIDHSWYHIIKRSSKTKSRTDSNAIMLLADIVYWHKPTHKIEENGNHSIHKKYKADLLQKSYTDLENQFGFTKDQARSAIETLESLGIVERVFRDIFIGTLKLTNVMYLKFHHKKLLELMKGYYQDPDKFKIITTSSEKTDDPLGKNRLPPLKKPTYTETTTEITSENDLIDARGNLIDANEILIFDFEGSSKKITKDDLHFIKAKFQTDWTCEEIQFCFDRLARHKGSVRDLQKFIDSIVKKERITKYTQQKNKGYKCKIQKTQIVKNQQESYVSIPISKKEQENSRCNTTENVTSGQILARAMLYL